MFKAGDIVYVHNREGKILKRSLEYNRKSWWWVDINGKETLCPEDLMMTEREKKEI